MTSTWQIIELKRTPSTGVVTGVVFAIDFQEGSEQTYIARDRYINEITLTGSPNEPGFIPFEN